MRSDDCLEATLWHSAKLWNSDECKHRARTICLSNKSVKRRTKAIAASMGVSVMCCDAGRARQMNFGAKVAKGKVFFSLTYCESVCNCCVSCTFLWLLKFLCYYHAHKLHCMVPIHSINQHVFKNHACLPYLFCALSQCQHFSSNFDVPAVLQGIYYASCMQTLSLLTS